MARGIPFLDTPECVGRHGERQGANERRLLDVGHELRRRDEPVGVLRRTSASAPRTPPEFKVDDRLVVDDDLAPLERALEIPDHASSTVRIGTADSWLVSRFVAYIWPSACARRSSGSSPSWEERPADRRVDLDVPTLDAVRAPERLPHATDERSSLLVPCRPERQDDELVPADPGDGVRRAHVRLQPACDRAQHLVARLVTADVVHPLEAVEVDDEERERLLNAA